MGTQYGEIGVFAGKKQRKNARPTGYAELPQGIGASIGRLAKPFTQRALAGALAALS
jgi:hypothetical protein